MTEKQYHKQFDRMMKRIESLYASKYQSIFRRTYNFASQIVAGGDPREAVNAVGRFSAELKQTIAANYNAAAVTFGSMVADQFAEEKSFAFERKEKLSQTFWNSIDRWVSLRTAEKVTRINNTTKNMIRGIIQAGLNDGESNSSIASSIKDAGRFSRIRASLIATTETHSAATNATKTMVADFKFKKEKRWMTAGDERVRESHANVSQEWIDEDEKFDVGGELLDIPGDPNGSARNVCRCRCVVMYRRKV